MIWDLLTGQVKLRFAVAWKLWVFSIWVSQLAWRVDPRMEREMRRYMAMTELLGRAPTVEEMG